MDATPMLVPTGSNPFRARYPGVCPACGDPYERGMMVRYNGNDEIVCCDEEGSGFDSFTPGRTPGIAVMPRGKTKRDVCGACFMIHASGQVECE